MRLLSYNIHKGIGGRDRKYRLERILAVIRDCDPDIACLQEVDQNVPRSGHDDQPQRLAEELGFPHRLYQRNVRVKRGGYGNLMLSRWPLSAWSQMSLRKGPRKPRGAQVAQVESPDGRFVLLHYHLGLGENERRWQVRYLLDHHLYQEAAHLPTLVAGDSNDWRNQLDRRCFEGAGFRHITQPAKQFRSFPAWLPMGSLDKAFVRGGIDVTDAKIFRTEISRQASDHLPLLIEFDLNAENTVDRE